MRISNKYFSLILVITLSLSACAQDKGDKSFSKENHDFPIAKTESEWKAQLSEQEYYVLREAGTERPFTGDLLENKKEGIYTCRACENPLFNSKTKFESGTGWPSFSDEIDANVLEDTDTSLGMARTEILCSSCGSHLGHVFNDGPKPTGLRYCVNSASLDFVEVDQ